MSSRKVFLAFDLGASSGRGILGYLENGKLELSEVHRFANGASEIGNSLHWDYPALCEEILLGLKKALEIEPELDGIGIDTWGVDYLLFDRTTGEPKRLPYSYRDSRTNDVPQEVWDNIISKTDIYGRTGIQHMQLNSLYQLVAHKRDHAEDFKNAILLPIPDALCYSLGGSMCAEYTHASTFDLLEPNSKEWDFELIDKLGIPRDIFPKIVPSCSSAGCLSAEIAKTLNCKQIPLFKVGSHDTASAVLAVPAPESGNWGYVSCGTWALLGAELDKPLVSPEAEAAPFTNEGGIGGKIRFLTNIMGSWLIQETKRSWKEAGKDLTFSEMEAMAIAAPAGQFLINPCSAEFLAPDNMPERIKAACEASGQGTIPDDGALLRTIYDSLALCFASNLEKMGSILNTEYQALNMVGGGTKDGLLMQLTADAAQIPVVAGPVEATSIGNILAQGMAAGAIDNIKEARQVVKNSFELKHYAPREEEMKVYASLKDKFASYNG